VRVSEGVTLKAAKGAVGSVVTDPAHIADPTVTHDPQHDAGEDQAHPPRDA
jgi:hypothetical protein